MEKDFFITQYVSNNQTEIAGKLKHLYCDFIVNEIMSDGTIVDVGSPEDVNVKEEINVSDSSLEDLLRNSPKAISEECVESFVELLSGRLKTLEIPVLNLSKLERTEIHKWIRKVSDGKLSSETNLDKISIKFGPENRKRKYWPTDRPDYLHFTLSKENKDSHFILSLIAKFLGTKSSRFGICGTKDRRAITSQRVSIYRYDSEQLRCLNSRLHHALLSSFSYHSKPCSLGDSAGNRFKIILRDIGNVSYKEIEDKVNSLSSNGFINYYGTQRFGSCGVDTAKVGLAILQKNWKKAVEIILGGRPKSEGLEQALKIWNETFDANEALKKLSSTQVYATIEGQVIKGLVHYKNDYFTTLMHLPRNTRSLYVHAYQSLIWNKVVSRRIREFGCDSLDGDIDINGKEVTTKDCFVLALPLPSETMKLPNNTISGWYEEYLKEDGICLETFGSLKDQFAIGDILRNVFLKLENISFELLTYAEPNAKLQSDLSGSIDSDKIGLGDYKALKISFSLPAGSYATVALRELTRCDMGKLTQSQLNVD